jgi:hypothetical protein
VFHCFNLLRELSLQARNYKFLTVLSPCSFLPLSFRLASSYTSFPKTSPYSNPIIPCFASCTSLHSHLTFRKHHHTLPASLVFIHAAIMVFAGATNTKHNQPGLKDGNVRLPKHPSNQPITFKAHDPTRLPFPASNNDNPTDNGPSVNPAAHNNNGSEPDNTPPGPNDTEDGGMSTLEKILTPPESDINPQSKNQDVKVFRSQWQPHIRIGPFYYQPPNRFKERKGAFNSRWNRINKRRKTQGNPAPTTLVTAMTTIPKTTVTMRTTTALTLMTPSHPSPPARIPPLTSTRQPLLVVCCALKPLTTTPTPQSHLHPPVPDRPSQAQET